MAKKMIKKDVIAQFKAAETLEELKKVYVDNIKEFGSVEANKKYLSSAFDKYIEGVKDKHKNKDGKVYTKAPAETGDEFKDLIASLLEMDGITIEVCGTWIWVGGKTKDNKDALKTCGFRYAAKKQMWYKAPEGTRHYKGKGGWDMNKIREAYGSHVVESAEEIA